MMKVKELKPAALLTEKCMLPESVRRQEHCHRCEKCGWNTDYFEELRQRPVRRSRDGKMQKLRG